MSKKRNHPLADGYAPDYGNRCIVCEQKPVVTLVEDGKVTMRTDMCGPCTWGEAETIDPDTWN